MVCAICGKSTREEAHVRNKSSFHPKENHRRWNIIKLCPNCHTKFDDGYIAICPDKRTFLVIGENGKIAKKESKNNIKHIKDEYIQWKNKYCQFKLRVILGLIPGYEHYSRLSDRGCP